jgi:hypothetical protein
MSDGPRAPACARGGRFPFIARKRTMSDDTQWKRGGTRIEISRSHQDKDRTLIRHSRAAGRTEKMISKTCASMTASVKLERVRFEIPESSYSASEVESADQHQTAHCTQSEPTPRPTIQLIMMSYPSTIRKPMILATSGVSEPPAKKREFGLIPSFIRSMHCPD